MKLRVVLVEAVAALALAPGASAGVWAHISADWNTAGTVKVSVLSDHRFNGSVENACVVAGATVTDETQPLTAWVYDQVAHEYVDRTTFDITAAGSGATCTITVMSGSKLLAQQTYVSV